MPFPACCCFVRVWAGDRREAYGPRRRPGAGNRGRKLMGRHEL